MGKEEFSKTICQEQFKINIFMHPLIFISYHGIISTKTQRSKQPMSLLTFFLKSIKIAKHQINFISKRRHHTIKATALKIRFQIIKFKKESINMQIQALKASQFITCITKFRLKASLYYLFRIRVYKA